MQDGLADFRIEHDKVIFLLFKDGRSLRINPSDLSKYLDGDDLTRVEHAIKVRGQFIKRILPPTVMSFMVAGIITLGVIDIRNISHTITQKDQQPRQENSEVKPVKSTPANSPSQPQVESYAPAASQTPAQAQGTPATVRSQAYTTPAASVLGELKSTPPPASGGGVSLPNRVEVPAIQVDVSKSLPGR